ncbi:portal protein [Magnetovibrio sp. PR-2]|uniref:portal protein n=1 Tax=Magnetovibrio sp. PR-2 TaxID=3120356 RepID=UPI002FCE5207
MDELTPEMIIKHYRQAKERRQIWESHWQDCYDFTLPQRNPANKNGHTAGERLFDGTAPDAVDQLAASLLSNLTPPWSRWIGLMPGTGMEGEDREDLVSKLDKVSEIIQSNIDRSNFAVEIHQCFLDLVTAGTACLMVEETPLGEGSALRFSAVPLFDVVFEGDANGALSGTLRRLKLTSRELKKRYPEAPELGAEKPQALDLDENRISVIEAVLPSDKGYRFMAVAEPAPGLANEAELLAEGTFDTSPFINFRWLKAPGEIYGRSPVMKALPDIKTANKIVELVLKNASISVTGIWQADDDGVLNPANIKLVPGAIIPKAVGSAGLTPLRNPGRFDISGSVLEGTRIAIRSALLADKLGQISGPRMSATEVVERSVEMARLLGATYGRLQSELLSPLIERAISVLRRRGEIPAISVDGRTIDIDYKSPLAQRQSQNGSSGAMAWLSAAVQLGGGVELVDVPRALHWLAKSYNIPEDILLSEKEMAQKLAEVEAGNGPVQSQSLMTALQKMGAPVEPPSETARIDPADRPTARTWRHRGLTPSHKLPDLKEPLDPMKGGEL